MSEWHDVQKELNTKLRDLLKSKQAKTRKPNELSKADTIRLAKLYGMHNELRRQKKRAKSSVGDIAD